ncbi:MAG: hypothetical protein COA49_07940 [Bacteroidetes bacterium]|nr:MAG: hypothetical protein COA49_07940 [Bacteroidota bacterium]
MFSRLNIFILIGSIFLSLCFTVNVSAQTSFFSPTLSDYRSSGWNLSLGGSGLGGSHSEFQEEWITENLLSGTTDTLYSGTWTPDGGFHLTGGIGRVWIAKRPLLADRFTLGVIGSKRSIVESFNGRVAPFPNPTLPPTPVPTTFIDSSLTSSASSINLGIYGSALRAIPISPDLFVELGLGASFRYDFKLDTTPPPLTRPTPENEYSPYSASLEIIVGAGVMIWRNRFMRVQFATDILQLAPINGTAKLPWMVGSYRPYRVIMNWDLFGHKPLKAEGSCAAPTHSEKARELFGKDMRGYGRAKNKVKKR